MFKDEFQTVCNAGKNKLNLLNNNPAGYFVSAILAGIFVAIGAFVCYSTGALLNATNSPSTKIIMAAVFPIALSLVIVAGSELVTGNVFILTSSALSKTITWGENCKMLIISYIGNFFGIIIAVAVFQLSGAANGAIGEMFVNSSIMKVAYSPLELIMRGILCNTLVCLAVWCSFRLKSEAAKLIIIFWCVFAFMICGTEHSVANMGILAVGLLNTGQEALTIGGYFYNLALSTLGNIIGGAIFVALPYYLISKNISK